MKITFNKRHGEEGASALLVTMGLAFVALALLGGAMEWSASSTRLTHRGIQYDRSVVAAEAATDMIIGRMTRDFLYGGVGLVSNSLNSYRQTVPTAANSSYWSVWEFNDASGNVDQTYVQFGSSSNNVTLNAPYAGLTGNVTTYTVVSHARDTHRLQDVTAGVLQEVQLETIPIFQFALYSSANMEISCGQPFRVTGRVHANQGLFVEPDNALTFESSVTAVTNALFHRAPGDNRDLGLGPGIPTGTTNYLLPDQPEYVKALSLPIGTTNTPEAVREIIEPPPPGGDTNLALGKLRYFNQSDLLLIATNGGVYAKSGLFDNFAISIPTNELDVFVTMTNSFYDEREGKTVRPIDLNIGELAAWSQTNNNLGPALAGSGQTFRSVYVVDARTLPANELGAVRVVNGSQLPANGLTVATGRPLYVQGDYNQTSAANLGTTNTLTTRPASLVADAITILSTSWTDANSTSALGSRNARATTVNAALLTGAVETTPGQYSGGMENFPRFLEVWGLANVFTYNGSMVKMFPSLYATNVWSLSYYSPPARNWAYDRNFNEMSKLPPLTPQLLVMVRNRWVTVAPGQNTPP